MLTVQTFWPTIQKRIICILFLCSMRKHSAVRIQGILFRNRIGLIRFFRKVLATGLFFCSKKTQRGRRTHASPSAGSQLAGKLEGCAPSRIAFHLLSSVLHSPYPSQEGTLQGWQHAARVRLLSAAARLQRISVSECDFLTNYPLQHSHQSHRSPGL